LAARAEGYTLINVFRTEDQVGLGYNDTRQYPEYSRSSAFDIETQTADQMISAIANSVALRKLAVSSSHGYFLWPNTARSDTLEKVLQWCNDNQIPVLSARDWGVLLRKSTPDPFTNIFPALQNDLDGDDNPDGYILGAGVNYNTTGGVDESAGYRLSLSSPGEVFSVDYLASVEKGLNQLTIWTKGFSGSELTVDVDGAGYGAISSQAVDASVSNWTRHQIEFTVPYSVLGILIQIDLTSHTSGLVEVSGLELRKKP
ncbi:MAG: hypothetical protein KDD04_03035, partial [Sinomicrobium sp.]|nr:hypothetical protein [Sinomicrobium sp.]